MSFDSLRRVVMMNNVPCRIVDGLKKDERYILVGGNLRITVTFEVGTDPDMATVLVQNRVKIAEPVLPDEVSRQGITTKKQSSNIVLTLCFFNPSDKKNREQGKTMSEAEIADRLHFEHRSSAAC